MLMEIKSASISENLNGWSFEKLYLMDFRKIRLASIGKVTLNKMLEDYSRLFLEHIIASVAGILIDGFGEK